jgi:hypothetical protein
MPEAITSPPRLRDVFDAVFQAAGWYTILCPWNTSMSIDFRALEDLNEAETYLLTTSAFRENWLDCVNEADMVSADRLCATLVASLGRGLARRSTRSQRASVVVGNSARSGLLEVNKRYLSGNCDIVVRLSPQIRLSNLAAKLTTRTRFASTTL